MGQLLFPYSQRKLQSLLRKKYPQEKYLRDEKYGGNVLDIGRGCKIVNIPLLQFDRIALSRGRLQAIVCEKKGENVSVRRPVSKSKTIKNEKDRAEEEKEVKKAVSIKQE